MLLLCFFIMRTDGGNEYFSTSKLSLYISIIHRSIANKLSYLAMYILCRFKMINQRDFLSVTNFFVIGFSFFSFLRTSLKNMENPIGEPVPHGVKVKELTNED